MGRWMVLADLTTMGPVHLRTGRCLPCRLVAPYPREWMLAYRPAVLVVVTGQRPSLMSWQEISRFTEDTVGTIQASPLALPPPARLALGDAEELTQGRGDTTRSWHRAPPSIDPGEGGHADGVRPVGNPGTQAPADPPAGILVSVGRCARAMRTGPASPDPGALSPGCPDAVGRGAGGETMGPRPPRLPDAQVRAAHGPAALVRGRQQLPSPGVAVHGHRCPSRLSGQPRPVGGTGPRGRDDEAHGRGLVRGTVRHHGGLRVRGSPGDDRGSPASFLEAAATPVFAWTLMHPGTPPTYEGSHLTESSHRDAIVAARGTVDRLGPRLGRGDAYRVLEALDHATKILSPGR